MATSVSLNGVSYTIPATGDDGWGDQVSAYLIAIASATLQKSGGAFTLTADVDFGANFGLKSTYYKSRGTVSTAGVLRLANAESIGWRNAANSADLQLVVNSSNVLTYAGNPIVTLALGTAEHALKMNAGGTAYEWGLLSNANIDAAAAIAWTKLSKAGSNLTDIATRSHTSLTDIGTNTHAQIDTAVSNSASHIANTSNPHSVTATQVGLGNVDNTSDATKNAASATLSNKTLLTPIIDDYLDINEETAPSAPAAGKMRLYFKNDNKLYKKNSSGVEAQLASTAEAFSNPMDDVGQIVYGGTAGAATKLAAGTSQNWLISGGAGAPTWGNTVTTGKVIDGTADENQLRVQGHSTQTNDILVVEKSDGTDLLQVTNANGTHIRGTTTNDSAATGYVGEIITANGTASNTSGAAIDTCTFTLTPGDWDVQAFALYNFNSSSNATLVQLSISKTTNTQAAFAIPSDGEVRVALSVGNAGNFNDLTLHTPVVPVSVATGTTKTYYVVTTGTWTTSTLGTSGWVMARRVR